MANAEQFSSTKSVSGASAIQNMVARIGGVLLKRADAHRTQKATRDLSDHIKRDIGLNVAPDTSSDFEAELRRIKSSYAW